MLRHSRLHHRWTHACWMRHRHRLINSVWWHRRPVEDPAWFDTHLPKMLGKKRKNDRRVEERKFRLSVKHAIAHDEPMPRYRHDWAD